LLFVFHSCVVTLLRLSDTLRYKKCYVMLCYFPFTCPDVSWSCSDCCRN